mmetsp:Transcript_53453/g.148103  ORF Transcript_53453/g.148103 Transcript_53453/m.148103 type:complete len:275 (+) Transcript_53453:83-907(+)
MEEDGADATGGEGAPAGEERPNPPGPAAVCLARWCNWLSWECCRTSCACRLFLLLLTGPYILAAGAILVPFWPMGHEAFILSVVNFSDALARVSRYVTWWQLIVMHKSAAWSEILQSSGLDRTAPTRRWQIPAALIMWTPAALSILILRNTFIVHDWGSIDSWIGVLQCAIIGAYTASFLPLCVCIELALASASSLRKKISTSDWEDGYLDFARLFAEYETLEAGLQKISRAAYRPALFAFATVPRCGSASGASVARAGAQHVMAHAISDRTVW